MDVTFSVTALNIWEDQEGQHHRKITNSKLTHTWLERYTVPTTVGVIKEGKLGGYSAKRTLQQSVDVIGAYSVGFLA
ncbi:hypothetical protein T4D_5872 [Trichinella pseudospiralis]|uniref:Uncharacterized protein n=1 Tax=Trichinella pseudospiralis TaxID=6337 RepID=A0A0V1FXX4_TRIPS|nr:hypothetical protein T4D_5872 [Trichinella pseudospiralis]